MAADWKRPSGFSGKSAQICVNLRLKLLPFEFFNSLLGVYLYALALYAAGEPIPSAGGSCRRSWNHCGTVEWLA